MLTFSESTPRSPACPLPGLVGQSEPMRRLARDVRRAARLPVAVVLRGESGTGKELVARALHAASARARGAFVAVNAAALTRDLAASELFGHRRGAFTGALSDRRGALREATSGTLLLDEIGSLALEVQPQLLRALELQSVRPVGSDADIPVDVRVIAATCEPLEAMVATGRFRADLYERLAGVVLEIPPVRERAGDVPLLAEHLLTGLGLSHRLEDSALRVLEGHPMPGNVRQLRNLLVHAAMLSTDERIGAVHVEQALAVRAGALLPPRRPRPLTPDDLRATVAHLGNVSKAARALGLPRTTFRRMMGRAC